MCRLNLNIRLGLPLDGLEVAKLAPKLVVPYVPFAGVKSHRGRGWRVS